MKDYLSSAPLIYREEGSATRNAMEHYFGKNSILGNMKLQLTSNIAIKQVVISGLGLSIIPLIGLKNELENRSIKIIPVKNMPIVTNWTLNWLKGKKLSLSANAYLRFIQTHKARLKEEHFSWIISY
jgi:DNA-binding transcriptional LysR family regulator